MKEEADDFESVYGGVYYAGSRREVGEKDWRRQRLGALCGDFGTISCLACKLWEGKHDCAFECYRCDWTADCPCNVWAWRAREMGCQP